ncbi:hypothetical protein [Limnohabitans planktonicus]|nr:hypothetical protein [Limnohabitans planktonicus]
MDSFERKLSTTLSNQPLLALMWHLIFIFPHAARGYVFEWPVRTIDLAL